jgi:hypothetical protein
MRLEGEIGDYWSNDGKFWDVSGERLVKKAVTHDVSCFSFTRIEQSLKLLLLNDNFS